MLILFRNQVIDKITVGGVNILIIKCLSLFILIGLVCPAIVFAQNKALSLDGDGDYVRVPHSKSLNLSDTVTLECRILRNSHNMFGLIAGNGGGWFDQGYHIMSHQNGSIRFELQPETMQRTMIDSNIISNDHWHHIAATYDGKTGTIYIDGNVTFLSEHANGMGNQEADFGIGFGLYPTYGGGGAFAGSFDGVIDEVRVWNVARTEEEIQAKMNSTLAGTEEGLVAYWNFDDGTVKDLTVNGNDGEFKGDANIIEVPLAIIEIGNYKFVDPTKIDFENPEEAEAAVNALIQQLSQNPDGNVRVSSAEKLGRIGKVAEAAIPALTRAFQDQNYNVRLQ